jgi:tRNA nucleotidyltransferase (CCA-adding enzyme)
VAGARAGTSSTLPAALARVRIPALVRQALAQLDAAGHRTWIVGGAVRDILLGGRLAADLLDLATPATPQEVMGIFERVVPTGVEHGTVTVLLGAVRLEVTTFRGEGAYLDGRRPSSVTFHRDIDADLARRDFTVNALAFDPLGRELRDPFGGRADMRRRILRAVGDPAARFGEDGLRPLRAARFAAQLGFAVDRATRAAIPGALPVVGRVAAERVQAELEKLLLAEHASQGLDLLESTGLLGVVLPAVGALAPPLRSHALAVCAAAPPRLALRLAALLHSPAAAEPPLAVARRAREALRALRFPAAVLEEAAALVAEHGCLRDGGRLPPPSDGPSLRRLAARLGRERLPALLDLREADARALPRSRARAELRSLAALRRAAARALRGGPPLAPGDLALDGRAVMEALGLPPGPEVGQALRHLLDRCLDDPRRNRRGPLLEELRAWWAARG